MDFLSRRGLQRARRNRNSWAHRLVVAGHDVGRPVSSNPADGRPRRDRGEMAREQIAGGPEHRKVDAVGTFSHEARREDFYGSDAGREVLQPPVHRFCFRDRATAARARIGNLCRQGMISGGASVGEGDGAAPGRTRGRGGLGESQVVKLASSAVRVERGPVCAPDQAPNDSNQRDNLQNVRHPLRLFPHFGERPRGSNRTVA